MQATQAAPQSTAALSVGDALVATLDQLRDLIAAQPTAAPTATELFSANPDLGPASRAFRELDLVDQLAYLRVLTLACRAGQIEQAATT
jgi:hypothetical protein